MTEVPAATKGPSEKLLTPTFNGEGDAAELGTSARSYLRQIAAWERMTKLSKGQQALVLYQNLQGLAWVNAESLNVESLSGEDGVTYFKEWIVQHYLDVEVTSVGRSLSDLFRKLRRKNNQTFRDYTAEFNRLLSRVVECGCTLPDVATAWLFVDRACLDEATEVSLLASVGNKYALRALQQAAIILDRSMRKPWEKPGKGDGRRNGYNTVNVANHGEDDDEDSDSDAGDLLENENEADLYVAYMTAKAKYREVAKARGTDTDPAGTQRAIEDKIRTAKSKSRCAACGKRGHWHRDPQCPKRQEEKTAASSKPNTIHVTNEIMELTPIANHEELLAILDTACSKTVVGTAWLQRYLQHTRGGGYDVEFIYEKDAFKFGAAHKIYEANYAAVIFVVIGGTWVAVKASVIHGDIPLLMSRSALAEIGLVLDLSENTAVFKKIASNEVKLKATLSGHPAVCVDHKGQAKLT